MNKTKSTASHTTTFSIVRTLAVCLVVLCSGVVPARAAGEKVYWTNYLSHTIGRADLDGTSPTQSWISSNLNYPYDVEVDSNYVYWANESTTLGRALIGGGSPVQSWISGCDYPMGVAVDSNYVYWANGNSTTIGRANLDGTSPVQSWISGCSNPSGVAVDSNYVYWTNAGNDTIGRANLDGTSPVQNWITGANYPAGVAVDSNYVYWTNYSGDTIGRALIGGGSPVQSWISTNVSYPWDIEVDSNYVYWAGSDSNLIGRANLDGSSPVGNWITGANYPIGVAITPPVSVNSDGSLTASGTVSEPVALPTTADSIGEAVNLFDFTITDGGGGDGLALEVSAISIPVSGTSSDAERAKVTWRLNGTNVSNVTGSYDAPNDEIDFTGLSISVADGGSETYTVNGYYNDNTGLTEGTTFILSVDGDTDLTVGGGGTQMGTTSAVNNSTGTTVDVTATLLAFTTQPAGSVSGSALTTQPVVAARDAFGNTDTGFTETITLTEGAAGSLSGDVDIAAVSGVATFTDVAYTATADQQSFTLTANDEDGVGTNLSTVNANAVTSDVVATQLAFTTQPAGSVSGSALTTQPAVTARDAGGLTDTGFTETITLTEGSAGGLTNNTQAASSGVATFSNLIYTATADQQSFTLTANDEDGVGTNLSTVNANAVTADVVATKLVFSTQPSPLTGTSGSVLDFTTDPVVEAQDANNVKDTGFTDQVTLLETGAGTATYANNTVTASAGVATFTGLTVTYTATADQQTFGLQADDETGGAEGNITTLPTSSNITADVVATKLVFTTQPSPLSGTSGSVLDFTTDPVVEARDANDVKDTGFTDQVTLTETGAGTATYANNTATASSGVATFTGLTVTYTATADQQTFGLEADDQTGGAEGNITTLPTSSAVTADVVATKLVFTTQPSPLSGTSGSVLDFTTDPVVEARDANDVKDTGFTDQVTLTETGAGTATYANNTATASSGVATFTGLTVTYTATADQQTFGLEADDQSGGAEGDITTLPTSSSITADVVATQLAFTTQPAGSVSGSALTTQPVVAAQDGNGVTDTGFTETITLTEGAAGGLSGDVDIAAVSGVATFTDVAYTATADQQSFTLTANDEDGVGTNLSTVNANAVTSDVVAGVTAGNGI